MENQQGAWWFAQSDQGEPAGQEKEVERGPRVRSWVLPHQPWLMRLGFSLTI